MVPDTRLVVGKKRKDSLRELFVVFKLKVTFKVYCGHSLDTYRKYD